MARARFLLIIVLSLCRPQRQEDVPALRCYYSYYEEGGILTRLRHGMVLGFLEFLQGQGSCAPRVARGHSRPKEHCKRQESGHMKRQQAFDDLLCSEELRQKAILGFLRCWAVFVKGKNLLVGKL